MKSVTELKIGDEFIFPACSASKGKRGIVEHVRMMFNMSGDPILEIGGSLVGDSLWPYPTKDGEGFLWFALLSWEYEPVGPIT